MKIDCSVDSRFNLNQDLAAIQYFNRELDPANR